jgi:hypothetical protein
MNDLELLVYKRKAKIELKIFIIFILSISVCLLILVGTNLINKFRSDALSMSIQNKQEFITENTTNTQTQNLKAIKFYKNLLNDGYTIDNLGNEKEFIKKISDSSHASKLYDALIAEGYNEKYLGIKKEFLSTFAIIKTNEEVEKEQKINSLNDEITLYRIKKDKLTFFHTEEIRQIILIWIVSLFVILYIMRSLWFFIKGIFVELR